MPAAQSPAVRVFLIEREERLRSEHDVRALAVGQRLADKTLTGAGGVRVGRIDEVDAGVERVLNDGDGVLLVRAAPEHHRAEAELTDLDARAT